MANTIFSIFPPIIAVLMVIFTRRVLLSLGVGIIASAYLLALDRNANGILTDTLKIIWNAVVSIFITDGTLNTWNVFILLFLFLLGLITAFITISGGSKAFGEWAIKRIKTRTGAQLLTVILGIIIFIDDYFNALAVGQVSRPITDRHGISRAKLAYLIDSTSAPICVISPISSWGAYIIALIAKIIEDNRIENVTAFSTFMQLVPMNLYVWTAIILVIVTIVGNVNIGPMQVHEERAKTGILHHPDKNAPGELQDDLPNFSHGTIANLLLPILTLVVGVVGLLYWTGYQNVGHHSNLITIFENTDVAKSLLYGGILGFIVTALMLLTQMSRTKQFDRKILAKAIQAGLKSMLPAIYILLFAWTIASLIESLQTGEYLASIVERSNIGIGWVPFILFISAGLMSFSTGTSWGSFSILLPIAGTIAASTDVTILLPALAAVLAGAVFGDHCSPISDTTILSATGAGCNHIEHVITQLPYALLAAIPSAIGFIIIGFSRVTILGLTISIILTVVFAFVLKKTSNK